MDAIDRQLIEILRANARITFAELARLVSLSAPAVHDRVNRLEGSGVIRGYYASVAPEQVGLQVSALVSLELDSTADQETVLAALEPNPALEDCWVVAGEMSLVVKVRVARLSDLEQQLGLLRSAPAVVRVHATVVLSEPWQNRQRLGATTP